MDMCMYMLKLYRTTSLFIKATVHRSPVIYSRVQNHIPKHKNINYRILSILHLAVKMEKSMGSYTVKKNQPHVVCIPYPAQGHVDPMAKLAKLLHHKGFYVTFVCRDFNYRRLLRSRGPNSLDGLPLFRSESIPDGLPQSDGDATQDIPSLCESTSKHCLAPFRQLLSRLNSSPDIPPVTCIVSDGVMSFTLDAAQELGVPEVLFWTTSTCGFLAYLHYRHLIENGLIPLKGVDQFSFY